MEVRVEMWMKMEVPDDTVDLKETVVAMLFSQRNRKTSEVLRYLKVTEVTQIDPWGGDDKWDDRGVYDDDSD